MARVDLGEHSLFQNGGPLSKGSDVVITTTDGVELYLHSLVLTMWSKVLGELVESMDKETLVVTDASADFLLLLGCMYPAPARVHLNQQNVMNILLLADKYHCPDIIDRCVQFLLDTAMPQLDRDSSCNAAEASAKVWSWLGIAQKYNFGTLSVACCKTLGKNFFAWNVSQQVRDVGAFMPRDHLTSQLLIDIIKNIPQNSSEQLPSSAKSEVPAQRLPPTPSNVANWFAAGGYRARPEPLLPAVPLLM